MAVELAALQAQVENLALGWTPGTTSNSSHSPFLARNRTGAIPPAGQTLQAREASARAKALEPSTSGLPAAFDWRNARGGNYVTPVADQGQCGSCVAFGCISVFESMVRIAAKQPNLPVSLSQAQLFFCWGPNNGAGACPDGGWWPDEAYSGMQAGIVDSACFPYTDANQACSLCPDWQTRISTFTSSTTVDTIAAMKAFISTVGPMTTCLTIYEDFYYYYTSGVYTHNPATSGDMVGGHCVAIVGYDDSLNCWIAKNQWGTDWGEDGFFRMSYGSCGIDEEMWGINGTISSPLFPEAFEAVGSSGVGTALQLVGEAGGKLWHTLRNADGTWHPSFGLVETYESDNPGAFTAISCAGDGAALQVVGVAGGKLWHTIRNADGSWHPSFGLVESVESNDPGSFTAVSSSAVSGELQVVGVAGGKLWHTIRNADGTWHSQFGLIEIYETNDPGDFTAVSCAAVGSELQVVGVSGGKTMAHDPQCRRDLAFAIRAHRNIRIQQPRSVHRNQLFGCRRHSAGRRRRGRKAVAYHPERRRQLACAVRPGRGGRGERPRDLHGGVMLWGGRSSPGGGRCGREIVAHDPECRRDLASGVRRRGTRTVTFGRAG